MSDYIKREVAVKNTKELFKLGGCYCDEFSIVGMLNSLPSEDVVPKDFHDKTCEAMAKRHTEEMQRYMWTPCSERLPEKYDYYLVTAQNHKYDDTYLVISWFESYWFTDAIAIAWMPLPEPYKESE